MLVVLASSLAMSFDFIELGRYPIRYPVRCVQIKYPNQKHCPLRCFSKNQTSDSKSDFIFGIHPVVSKYGSPQGFPLGKYPCPVT